MRQRLLTAAVVCAALCAATTARAEIVFNDTSPFSITFFNECTGEDVFIEGDLHEVVSVVERKDGTIQTHNNIALRGFGIGLDSGAVYRVNDTFINKTIDPPGVAFSDTGVEHIRLIGLGRTPNERVIVSFDVEVDEFGMVTAVFITEVICQGD